jgi:chaperonin cofactor prefoldin
MKGWIVFSIGLLLFACANSKHMRILDKDLDRLQSRINILQKENNSIKNEVSDLRTKNQELKTDLCLLLDNLESEIRTLSTSFEEYKEVLKRAPEEIYRFKEEMRGRLRLEERRGTKEERFTEIEDRLRALDGKTDRLLIRINSWSNQ